MQTSGSISVSIYQAGKIYTKRITSTSLPEVIFNKKNDHPQGKDHINDTRYYLNGMHFPNDQQANDYQYNECQNIGSDLSGDDDIRVCHAGWLSDDKKNQNQYTIDQDKNG